MSRLSMLPISARKDQPGPVLREGRSAILQGRGMASEYEARKRLTFEQVEGAQSLPSQLQPKQISSELRALLWEVLHKSMRRGIIAGIRARNPWEGILYNIHVYRNHRNG